MATTVNQNKKNENRRLVRRELLAKTVILTGAGVFLLMALGLVAGKLELVHPGIPKSYPAVKGALATAGDVLLVPGAAHVSGANNTNWRTDVEVRATGSSVAEYSIALLKKNQANNSPVTRSFQLAAGKSKRLADILAGTFNYSGSGALKITVTSGSILVTSRTYNQTSSGTYGQFIPGVLKTLATTSTRHCRLVQLTQSTSTTSGYRSNIGLVNTTPRNFSVRLDLYRATGAFLGSKSYALRPWEVKQVDRVFTSVTSAAVGDGYAVISSTSSGSAFLAYASVVDNATGDPVYEPAITLAGAAPGGGTSPTPTPQPTPTPPPSGNLDLEPFTPDDWQNPLVVSGTEGSSNSGDLTGGWATYIDWAIVNWGPEDAVFPAGKYIVSILLDNTTLVNFNSNSEFVLEGGYYYSYEDWETYDIDSGQHTVQMLIDAEHSIAESNEGNNSFSYTGNWEFVGSPNRQDKLRIINVPVSHLRRTLIPEDAYARRELQRKAVGSNETYYIPAAAHAAGFGGSVWRSDVEVHNAGTGNLTCAIDLLKKDFNNSSPVSTQITVGPGHSRRLGDVLNSRFSFTGSAALRLRLSGGIGVITSRTYNQTSQGTYGQFIGAVSSTQAISSSGQAALIQLTHNRAAASGFRTNIGLLNCANGAIDLRVDLYRSNGSKVGSVPVHLKALSFHQVDRIYEIVVGGDVADGYATVACTTSGGKFLAFASVIDNRTGDPIYVPALAITGGGGGGDVTGTMGPGEVGSILDIFRQAEDGSGENIGDVLVSIINDGMETALDHVAQQGASRITRGLAITVSSEASSGSISATYSGYTHTSSSAAWDYHVNMTDPVFRQRVVPFSSVSGHVSQAKHGSTVTADISVNASGSNASAGGSAHIDTSVCTTMPIAGSIDITVQGATSTVTFTDQCGVYNLKSPGSLQFRVRLSGLQIPMTNSQGHAITEEAANFYLMTDGPLGAGTTTINAPKCANTAYSTSWASGSATATSLHADFVMYKGWGFETYTLIGSYDATTQGGGYWSGTVRLHASNAQGSGSEVSQTENVVTICSMDGGLNYSQCYSCQ